MSQSEVSEECDEVSLYKISNSHSQNKQRADSLNFEEDISERFSSGPSSVHIQTAEALGQMLPWSICLKSTNYELINQIQSNDI